MKLVEFISELFGWVRIVISFCAVGCGIGAIIYSCKKDSLGIYIGIFIAVIGLVIGIVVATKTWKGGGTMHALSRTMASPELDSNVDTKGEKNS